MPRMPRERCEHSIYHIMVRGNNQQAIFLDDADKNRYLQTLKRYKEKYKVDIYAYCLMTNHVHLLIYDNGQDISRFMQGLNLSYVRYFNTKYERSGHLFQGRFTSMMVKRDNYFIYVSRYIHLNPVKAQMVKSPRQYDWSSYPIYLGEKDKYQLINKVPILKYFSNDFQKAAQEYASYLKDVQADEEIALTIEQGSHAMKKENTSKKVDIEDTFNQLINYFHIPKAIIITPHLKKYTIQRSLIIYLLALKTKRTYKEIATLFYIQPSSIGYSVHRAIDMIQEDEKLGECVEEILQKVA